MTNYLNSMKTAVGDERYVIMSNYKMTEILFFACLIIYKINTLNPVSVRQGEKHL